jgi:hypothetical protein
MKQKWPSIEIIYVNELGVITHMSSYHCYDNVNIKLNKVRQESNPQGCSCIFRYCSWLDLLNVQKFTLEISIYKTLNYKCEWIRWPRHKHAGYLIKSNMELDSCSHYNLNLIHVELMHCTDTIQAFTYIILLYYIRSHCSI